MDKRTNPGVYFGHSEGREAPKVECLSVEKCPRNCISGYVAQVMAKSWFLALQSPEQDLGLAK